jgi:hypothetical protein
MDPAAADRMLAKLRTFVQEDLAPDERAALAALVAPGAAMAHQRDEVEGYAMLDWRPRQLPDALAEAVRRAGIRVIGLEPDDPPGPLPPRPVARHSAAGCGSGPAAPGPAAGDDAPGGSRPSQRHG